MDKNQWVISGVVVAFVFVGVFLYLVFSSNRYDAQQAENGDDESALSVDDALKQLVSEKEDGAGATAVTKPNETVKTAQNTQVVTEKISKEVATRKTPATGPGFIATFIAGMMAMGIAAVTYAYTKKEYVIL
ncbi:MAG: hypothetical protein WC819_01200 [Parcubacteria group bacterium]|jgi:hypothetical protein